MSTEQGRVFKYVVNEAAFIDKVVVSIPEECTLRLNRLKEARNIGVYRPGRLYKRCLQGRSTITDNPVQVLYGKSSKFENVPAFRVTMRSETMPLSWAQLQMCLSDLFDCSSLEAENSLVELTLDSDRVTIKDFDRLMVTKAQTFKMLEDHNRRKTLYVGSPISSWQARVYQKTERVVRLEFVLRRSFLSREGLKRAEQLVALRNFPIGYLLSLRSFSKARCWNATRHWTNKTGRHLICEWGERKARLRVLASLLRYNHMNLEPILAISRRQLMYERMLRHLYW